MAKILGISGSLRQGSFNTMALRAAAALVPAGSSLGLHDLRDIPPYDEDVRAVGFPAPVRALREAVGAADALLLATPEYNYSFSGVLKNAIDWVSRPPEQPFADKPIAVMSASMGVLGGARAQYHLRQCFIFLDAKLLNRPEVMIGQAQTKFSAEGALTDAPTARIMGEMLQALIDWARRLRA
mgnify:CR=1 FL=1